jgi:hypothetical protein
VILSKRFVPLGLPHAGIFLASRISYILTDLSIRPV